MYQERSGYNQGGIEVVGQESTDASGYFLIKLPHTAKELTLRIDGVGGEIMYEIPGKNDIQNLEVIFPPRTKIIVSLNILNLYTISDTLFITDYNNIYVKKKIPGPFVSGILYTTSGFTIPTYKFINSPMDIGYKINNGSWILKDFFLIPCQESEITVDIN